MVLPFSDRHADLQPLILIDFDLVACQVKYCQINSKMLPEEDDIPSTGRGFYMRHWSIFWDTNDHHDREPGSILS